MNQPIIWRDWALQIMDAEAHLAEVEANKVNS
jgi:hypothetical protein